MNSPINSNTINQWIEQLQQLNQQQYLPRRKGNNQRTTFNLDKDIHILLKQLQCAFNLDAEWKAFNRVLMGCLHSIEAGNRIQPDRIVIPYLQHRLDPRFILPKRHYNTIAIHRNAKPVLATLRTYFQCKTDWRTFNHALIHCLNGNERLIAVCHDAIGREDNAA